jgi:hypothetical protein
MKEIEQLLKIIAQHDLRDEYIAPEPNRGKEIGEVIAKEVGAFFEDLCIEDRTGKTEKDIKYSFSARPSDFVRDALKSIDKAIKELKKLISFFIMTFLGETNGAM